ncbi:glycosyl transferase [Saccharopolyspora indica]|uniref:macrolide family glycosyltransferase n=1 Tax=Saccharopolyspora indica TaxID=1229659 RepID=UPI0022EB83E3|nr:macrolide family glycosyltransferase [Saccharopolyspora indica]MDA3647224.1 glycosyltransferase [Saccharopolyspora indica]
MTRIALAGMPAYGHLNPSLPIVRELVSRGVEVTYCTSAEFREQVEAAGCEFREYPRDVFGSATIAEATRLGGPVRVAGEVLKAAEVFVPFLLAEFEAERPDAVVFDSNALWGRMAAAKLGLPMISLMTTVLIGTKEMPGMTFREWTTMLREVIPNVTGPIATRRRVQRRFGKETYPSSGLPMRGDLTLFPVPEWMQPPSPSIDDTCRFVGPTIPAAGQHLDPELARFLDGPGPLVLVSLGTLHTGTEAFFRTCFEALSDLPIRALLATGARSDPALLGAPPENVLLRQSIPQLEVLRKAAAFVTHGGMNSALEGLACGVPLVVVPQQAEQLLIGKAIADRGAATVLRHNLSHRPVPPEELRAAVRQALTDPSHRAAARNLSATLAEGGGAPAAADHIQNFLETRALNGN